MDVHIQKINSLVTQSPPRRSDKYETKSQIEISKMAGSVTALAVLPANSIPKILSGANSESHQIKRSNLNTRSRRSICRRIGGNFGRENPTKLFAAGLYEIEPDLNEDKREVWKTNGIEEEDFLHGKYDGHHTYYESDEKGSFWGAIADDYNALGPPSGFQGLMSWLFLPAILVGMYFDAPGEYLFIGAAVFTVIFCVIEMNKPSEAHNFEPQIYNMERGARDKLINDYNTMEIWDFNEKYGDLWDFTVEKDDIMKR